MAPLPLLCKKREGWRIRDTQEKWKHPRAQGTIKRIAILCLFSSEGENGSPLSNKGGPLEKERRQTKGRMSKRVTTQSCLENLSRGCPSRFSRRKGRKTYQTKKRTHHASDRHPRVQGTRGRITIPCLSRQRKRIGDSGPCPSRSREKASLERDGRSEGTNEQEDDHPLAY